MTDDELKLNKDSAEVLGFEQLTYLLDEGKNVFYKVPELAYGVIADKHIIHIKYLHFHDKEEWFYLLNNEVVRRGLWCNYGYQCVNALVNMTIFECSSFALAVLNGKKFDGDFKI